MDDYLQGPPADIVTEVKVGVTVECLVDGFGEANARATVREFVGTAARGGSTVLGRYAVWAMVPESTTREGV